MQTVKTAPFETEQEAFWAGEFGDDYALRNRGNQWIANNVALFGRILRTTDRLRSVMEFGANTGLNLQALRILLPEAELSAVEINSGAVAELEKIGRVTIYHQSILDYEPATAVDLSLIKGVLIHIHPDRLATVYEILYRSSSRYICLAEYYNPTPVAIPYRGFSDRLFKRDFAGEMLKQFLDLRLRDYGFVYRGDPKFPQDDITWFLMEKSSQ